MIDCNKYIIKLSHCIYVDGYMRGLFCDIQRELFVLVPKDLGYIINKFENKTISDVYDFYDNDDTETLDQYFKFLSENELIYFSSFPKEKSGFTGLRKRLDDTGLIDFAIIDLDATTDFSIVEIIGSLLLVGCKHFQIRFFCEATPNVINHLAEAIQGQEIVSIEILMPYSVLFEDFDFESFFINNQTFSDFNIYNAPKTESTNYYNSTFKVSYKETRINNSSHCGLVSPEYFVSNSRMYDTAIHKNSCLNRKVGIDSAGYIKNCPSMIKHFGNVKTDNINEIIKKYEFQQLSNIKKDSILVCKDCEFRYVCTDCRAFLESPNDNYSKPLKCGYDPYTATWSNWTENEDKRSAIEYYQLVNIDFK